MELTEFQRKWLQHKAISAAPEEACGFIMSDNRIVEIPNSFEYPYKGFEMKVEDLEQIDPKDVAAIWHTHPSGTTHPSSVDIQSMNVGAVRPEWSYFIASKDDVAQWNPRNYAEPDWREFMQ